MMFLTIINDVLLDAGGLCYLFHICEQTMRQSHISVCDRTITIGNAKDKSLY